MPPHQTNLTSETGRDATGLGLDLSIALVKDAMDEFPTDALVTVSRARISAGNAMPHRADAAS